MYKNIFSLILLAALAGCADQPQVLPVTSKKLVVTIVDYSKSYRNLITLDSQAVQSLFACVGVTGGTIAHIAVQDNSNLPIYLTRVEKIDTNSTATTNMYEQARERNRNGQILGAYRDRLNHHVSAFLHEMHKFKASSFTDLHHAFTIAHSTVCEPIYTERNHYKRYVLVLSDMIQDMPGQEDKLLVSADMCNATIIIVRPDNSFTQENLQNIFNSTDVHVFSNLPDAITFIQEQ